MQKTRLNIRNGWIIVTILLLGPLAGIPLAQNTTPPLGPGTGGHRPQPPIFAALDANHDGIISASEIANAAAALKTLDKNVDGKLTPDEYRPPRPAGAGAPRNVTPQAQPGQARPLGADLANSTHPQNVPGPKTGLPHPPKPPIDLALDADQDGIISAAEIANAATSLKRLDKSGDGALTPDECLPQRPGRTQTGR